MFCAMVFLYEPFGIVDIICMRSKAPCLLFNERLDFAGVEAGVTREVVNSGVWHCSICTYDNEESMNYCEMCGVLRIPPSNSHNNIEKAGNAKNFIFCQYILINNFLHGVLPV